MDYGFIDIKYDGISHAVPTIMFGNGLIRITTMFAADGESTGIGFSQLDSPVEIGSYTLEDDKVGRELDPLFIQKQVKCQLMFDNPKSIDVVIERLIEAKEELIKMQDLLE